MAQWLGVPADWLRFGAGADALQDDAADNADGAPRFASDDVKLFADFQLLDDHHRQIAREFIRMLLRVGRKK
ncbi:hypothetical protein ACFQAT_25585 [Undibacterium arcticum]|uniref:hypothetical protein n=1 Tax=Undibacterium arcticum TaxID=1762892 RepID=UPI003616F6C6